MRTVRLLPILVTGMLCLLVLKSVGLMTGGGYMFAGSQAVFAQTGDTGELDITQAEDETGITPEEQNAEEGGLTRDQEAAAEAAADNLFSDQAAPMDPNAPADAVPTQERLAGDPVPLTGDGSETEQAVLSRLSERRAELDKLQAEIEERENLVAAAEARLAERARNLEALETRINQLVDEKAMQQNEQFAGLVSMYENMKPKDAAVIFNDLSMDILLRVALTMNPRKMSPILAEMRPERAQELTVAMAQEPEEPMLDAPIDQLDALPQIVGQ